MLKPLKTATQTACTLLQRFASAMEKILPDSGQLEPVLAANSRFSFPPTPSLNSFFQGKKRPVLPHDFPMIQPHSHINAKNPHMIPHMILTIIHMILPKKGPKSRIMYMIQKKNPQRHMINHMILHTSHQPNDCAMICNDSGILPNDFAMICNDLQ